MLAVWWVRGAAAMTLERVFLVLWWVWMAGEFLLQVVTRTRKKEETRDRGSLYILLPAIWLSIWLGSWYAGVHGPTMRGSWPLEVGFGLFVTGLVVRVTAIAMLGRAFSVNVAIHSTQTLYRAGLYRVVRHPSYTGLVLILFGLGFATRNWAGMAMVVVPSTAALLYRIHVEEAALLDAFGESYRRYSLEVKRLIPGIY